MVVLQCETIGSECIISILNGTQLQYINKPIYAVPTNITVGSDIEETNGRITVNGSSMQGRVVYVKGIKLQDLKLQPACIPVYYNTSCIGNAYLCGTSTVKVVMCVDSYYIDNFTFKYNRVLDLIQCSRRS